MDSQLVWLQAKHLDNIKPVKPPSTDEGGIYKVLPLVKVLLE